MRRVLLLALIMLVVPSAAAAGDQVTSGAPIELRGTVLASAADKLTLFHLAYANGTLAGTVINGTLWEDHRHEVMCSIPSSPPPGLATGTESHAVRQYASDKPGRFEAQVHSMLTGTFSTPADRGLRLPDASSPGALIGPNPYLYVPSSKFVRPGFTDDEGAEAFPRSEFIIAPNGRLEVTEPLDLELEGGNLTIRQGGAFDLLSAGREERQDIQCPSALGSISGSYYTTKNYRLTIRTGTLTVLQNGLTGLHQYYAAERGVSNPYREASNQPPRGYWHRDRGESLQHAYDEYALPSTFLAGAQLRTSVEGVVELTKPEGAVAGTNLNGNDAKLSGKLLVTPLTQSDQGRRMESRIDGDVFLTQVDAPGTRRDYTPYVAGAAAGVLFTGLLVYLWPGFKFRLTQLLLLPLYARLKREDILENAIRDDILHVVGEQPGISASELGRRLECGWGTLVYHLTVLERMKLLSSAREGRHKRFFVQGRINYSDKSALAILANPAARIILDAIRKNPGIIQKDLGDRVGLSPGTVAWHVDRLEASGLVLKEEDGRSVRYLPSERLIELTNRMAA